MPEEQPTEIQEAGGDDNRTIKGIIYDEQGETIIGASVLIKGEETGTTSDMDGKFSLDSCRCVGACGLAPVVMIGEKVYGRLQPVDVKKIIEELE